MTCRTGCQRQQGFTIIELMVAVTIVGALAGLAIPNYLGYLDKARLARCIAEIRYIERAIDSYEAAVRSNAGAAPACFGLKASETSCCKGLSR